MANSDTAMESRLESLPEELRLSILSFVSPADLWLHVRYVNNQYREYAEDVASRELIPRFTIGLNFTLSSGSHHRWYDVRGTVHHGFKYINRLNPQYALFEINSVHPKDCHDRVLQTWKRMCASGFGPEQEWRVTFHGTGILMKMPKLVMATDDGIWCDWRELLGGYLARLPSVWEGRVHFLQIKK